MKEQPVEPVEAASVILVRHGEPAGSPWQCFMVRRHIRSDFAADVFVFPGGKVDAADRDPALSRYVEGHPDPEYLLAESFETWCALRVAAIRELFEEAGVLLAYRDDSLVPLDATDLDGLWSYRVKLQRAEATILDVIRKMHLRLAGDALHPFSRWITPEASLRRYDTHFFVAYLPSHQTPVHDARETTAGDWIAPAEALRRYQDGTFPLVFATEQHLRRMARFRSIEQMIAATRTADLQPIMPRAVQRNGQTVFLLPGDPGY